MKEAIKKQFSDFKNEECGIIYFDKKVKLKKCENIASRRFENFEISIKDYLDLKKEFQIFGLYHSHIEFDERFSSKDVIHSEELMVPYFVYSFKTKKSNLYIPKSLNLKKATKSLCNFLKRIRKEYGV
jgi:proteasome lid subunit RPN8/RPN11